MKNLEYNPYIKSIWELAVISKDLEEWTNKIKKMEFILNYYKKNKIVKYFVFNKNIKQSLDKDSIKILTLLLENNQINKFSYIIFYFEYKILNHYNIVKIQISSAFILTNTQKKQIINILSFKLKKKIFIKKIKIKKYIIGGVIIKAKNIIIDCSMIGRLNKLKKNLLG